MSLFRGAAWGPHAGSIGWDAWHGDAKGRVALGMGAPRGWRGHGELHGDTALRAGDKRGACLLPPLPPPSPPLTVNLCSAGADAARRVRDNGGGTSAPSLWGSTPLLWGPCSNISPLPKSPVSFAGPASPREPGKGLRWRHPCPPLEEIKGLKHHGSTRAWVSLPLAPTGGAVGGSGGWGRGGRAPWVFHTSIECCSMGSNSTFPAGY